MVLEHLLFFSSCFIYLFRLHCRICGILVPPPGIKPVIPAVEAQSPNDWTTRESPGASASEFQLFCSLVEQPWLGHSTSLFSPLGVRKIMVPKPSSAINAKK